jgi:hypothetical protein
VARTSRERDEALNYLSLLHRKSSSALAPLKKQILWSARRDSFEAATGLLLTESGHPQSPRAQLEEQGILDPWSSLNEIREMAGELNLDIRSVSKV